MVKRAHFCTIDIDVVNKYNQIIVKWLKAAPIKRLNLYRDRANAIDISTFENLTSIEADYRLMYDPLAPNKIHINNSCNQESRISLSAAAIPLQ